MSVPRDKQRIDLDGLGYVTEERFSFYHMGMKLKGILGIVLRCRLHHQSYRTCFQTHIFCYKAHERCDDKRSIRLMDYMLLAYAVHAVTHTSDFQNFTHNHGLFSQGSLRSESEDGIFFSKFLCFHLIDQAVICSHNFKFNFFIFVVPCIVILG